MLHVDFLELISKTELISYRTFSNDSGIYYCICLKNLKSFRNITYILSHFTKARGLFPKNYF